MDSKVPPVMIAVLVVGFISIAALMKSCGSTGKIEEVKAAIPTDVVASKDLQAVKEQVSAVDELEKKITAMSTEIDSLKKEVENLVEASKKKPVPRRKKKRY